MHHPKEKDQRIHHCVLLLGGIPGVRSSGADQRGPHRHEGIRQAYP